MAMITVDFRGTPVTKHSMCCDFCDIMRSDPENARYCQKCDSRAGLEAVRINKPFIYLCHCNIIDVAIPIIIDDKYIGAIMAGQVMLDNDKDSKNLERMRSDFDYEKNIVNDDRLKENYTKIHRFSYERIKDVADMIWHISNYIVGDAITRNVLFEINQRMSQVITGSTNFNGIEGYPVDILKDIKEQINKQNDSDFLKNKDQHSNNSILEPALDYIKNNVKENITMSQMAKKCHVSSNYFSRLFVKETGEKFTTYVAKAKIAYAKNLLETTDIPITEMAYSIGFNDSGYFIKQFKKFEGVTPSTYRKYSK